MVGLKDRYTAKSLTLNTSTYSPPNLCALSSLCLLSACSCLLLFVCLHPVLCRKSHNRVLCLPGWMFGFQLKLGRHCSLIWCPANWMLPTKLSAIPCVNMLLPFSALPSARTYQSTSRSTANGETVWNTGWTFKTCSSGRSEGDRNAPWSTPLPFKKVITMAFIPGGQTKCYWVATLAVALASALLFPAWLNVLRVLAGEKTWNFWETHLQQMSPNTMFRKGTSHHNIKYQTFFWLQWKKNSMTFSPFSTAQLDPRWLPCKLGGRPNSFLPFSACAEQRTAISHVVRKSWRTQRYGCILLVKKKHEDTWHTHTFSICIDNEHNIIYNDYH